MTEKYLFLDIDGVLNDRDTKERTPMGNKGVDDRYIKNLQHIIKETAAKIILSSDWKIEYRRQGANGPEIMYLIKRLGQFGLYITDVTIAGDDELKRYPESRSGEIRYWLKKNHAVFSKWAMLDDHYIISEKGVNLKKHLVITQTPGNTIICGYHIPDKGLTPELADRVIDILNGGRQAQTKAV